MINKPVYLDLANPYAPLTSDRTAIWLASLAAVYRGTSVRCLESDMPKKDSLLVTNRRQNPELSEQLDVIRLETEKELLEKCVRRLGILYGRMPSFHAKGGNSLRSALTSVARTVLSPGNTQISGDNKPEPENETGEIPPREIAFRLNVDWDKQGFEALVSFMEQEKIPLTIAAAVDEIKDNTVELKELVSGYEIEIASHSMGHYIFLPGMNRKKQSYEIRDSRHWLQDKLETEVKGFVAPYMRYDQRSFETIQKAGYEWFIRTWALCPVPLQGTSLTDLGVSYYLRKNWKEVLPSSLRSGNLLFQLHLPDMHSLSGEICEMVAWLKSNNCRFVTCSNLLKHHNKEKISIEQ